MVVGEDDERESPMVGGKGGCGTCLTSTEMPCSGFEGETVSGGDKLEVVEVVVVYGMA